MFTGLVEGTGKLIGRASSGGGARLTVACSLGALALGESIAVDGVCLTVDRIVDAGFECDASQETLAVTTLGSRSLGGAVNLERAVPLGGRMGGHIVSGHVDGPGTLSARRPLGTALELVFAFPPELARFIAAKGSIAVDGVSLTVNHVRPTDFDVVIIPHTQAKTSLERLAVGGQVNLEVDLLARYVARLLEASPGGAKAAGDPTNDATWLARLQRTGYM